MLLCRASKGGETQISQIDSGITATDDAIIRSWLHGRPLNTASAYDRDARQFLGFLGRPLAEVSLPNVQAWHAQMDGNAPATQARRLAAVKSLLTFAHRVGFLPANVGQMVQSRKPPAAATERILSEAEVNRMIAGETDPRAHALLRLLYLAGLRASEAAALRWRDMTRTKKGGEARIVGKGGKRRTVGITAALWAELSNLSPNAKPDAPAVPDREGGQLNRQLVHRIVKRAARRVGLAAGVSPHWLRHSHASHALDRGAPPHVVQSTLGHASLNTTTGYAHVRRGDSSSQYLPE